jgi:hypothetical protein
MFVKIGDSLLMIFTKFSHVSRFVHYDLVEVGLLYRNIFAAWVTRLLGEEHKQKK